MTPEVMQAQWFKSSSSSTTGCVEVAFLPGRQVGVRDSKHLTTPPHILSRPAWVRFLSAARQGDFDLPATP
jgi:hypothetical protein